MLNKKQEPKSPYNLRIAQLTKETHEFDTDGRETLTTHVLIENQTPTKCVGSKCGVWHHGKCRYGGK